MKLPPLPTLKHVNLIPSPNQMFGPNWMKIVRLFQKILTFGKEHCHLLSLYDYYDLGVYPDTSPILTCKKRVYIDEDNFKLVKMNDEELFSFYFNILLHYHFEVFEMDMCMEILLTDKGETIEHRLDISPTSYFEGVAKLCVMCNKIPVECEDEYSTLAERLAFKELLDKTSLSYVVHVLNEKIDEALYQEYLSKHKKNQQKEGNQ